jgi:hypothetical protein
MTVDLQNQALQIFGLGNIQDHGVIRSRLPAFQKTNSALRVSGRIGHHAMELVPGNVMGAGASHQRSARAQHLEGTQVELLVTTQSAGYSTLGFGKSRGVEHHRVEGSSRRAPVAQKIEGVGLDPLHRRLDAVPVDLQILFRNLECCPGGIDARDPCAGSSQVQRKATLVGTDVERLSMSMARGGGIVQALVEESARLLPGVGVVVESQPVQVKDSR